MTDRTHVVRLPKLGMQTEEAEILEWHVRPGDQVAQGDELCGIATDKIDTSLESPVEGQILSISAEVGQLVRVGDPLCEIALTTSE